MRLNSFLYAMLGAALIASAADARVEPKAASGQTQVVAKVGGREVTLSELRAEMAQLGLSIGGPEAERIALDSILNRALLSQAARAANLHRRPEAALRIKIAEDQALADLYLATASQPPEPTPEEIEDFIAANPSLFADRRVYDFQILSLAASAFDEKALSPLFDREADFTALSGALKANSVDYAIAGATQPSTAFPKPVREQLARYSVSDNIVIKGDAQAQIMKIMRVEKKPAPAAEWGPLARRLLIEEAAGKRADALVARLKREAGVSYYRVSAAPAKPAAPEPQRR
jgi:EpsD family peptidyl-prolyl cis-trans isomerase